MDRNFKLILITGFPRSGTTWIEEEVAKRFDVDYIFEPFSIRYHPTLKHSLHLRNLISNYLNQAYHHHGWYYPDDYRPEDQNLFHQHVSLLRKYYKLKKPTLVIKQPFSVKLNWALQALHPDHVFWIDRHPGGILASYQQRNLLDKWTEKEFSLFQYSDFDKKQILVKYISTHVKNQFNIFSRCSTTEGV
jgi:hypothetical protein